MEAVAVAEKPTIQQRKPRANPDWPIRVYKYWIRPIGDVPDWLWQYAHQMQNLWNEMVAAHDAFIESRKQSEEADGKWDTERKRAEFAAMREKLKNLAKACKGLMPNSCYYEVRDSFLVAMGRYWNPDGHLKRLRAEKKNFDLGRPKVHHSLRKVLIPHDLNKANVPADIIFAGRKPLSVMQRTAGYGPTRGYFEAAGNEIHFNVNLHRPIPAGNIKRIVIAGNRELCFGWEWSLQLTIEEPPPPVPAENGRIAAIDQGWRLFDDYIRIGMLADNSGNVVELRLPVDFAGQDIRRQVRRFSDYPDAVLPIHTIQGMWDAQSEADLKLEECKAALERQVGLGDLDQSLLGNKQAWNKTRNRGLIKIHEQLKVDRPDAAAAGILKQWRDETYWFRRRWHSAYGRFLRWRTECFRTLAAALVETYDEIIFEGGLRVSDIASDDDMDPAVKNSMKYRQWSAPAEFRNEVAKAILKRGKKQTNGKTAYSTATCAVCDSEITVSAKLMLTCSKGHRLDQDVNAARNLLRWSIEDRPELKAVRGDASWTKRPQISRCVRAC